MHYHCITGQLIRSHANSKMFLWHLRKVSNGLQLDACNNENECYNRSLNISNGIKYMEITSKYVQLYDPLYTQCKVLSGNIYIYDLRYQYIVISYNIILPNMILSSTTVRERNILSRQWSMVCDQNHSFITFIRLSPYLYHFVL